MTVRSEEYHGTWWNWFEPVRSYLSIKLLRDINRALLYNSLDLIRQTHTQLRKQLYFLFSLQSRLIKHQQLRTEQSKCAVKGMAPAGYQKKKKTPNSVSYSAASNLEFYIFCTI